jgi:rod shape-determining protein MreD
LLGFTAGILEDLMGSGTLGLWAMTLTTVAYASSRLRAKFQESMLLTGVLVFTLTLGSQLLFVMLGTLFGQNLTGDTSLAAKIILPAVWNLLLAYPFFWLFGTIFKQRSQGWAT